MLYRLSLHITGDGEDAKECVNDAYLKAWRLIPPNEPNEYLSSFLSKIVRNTAFDRLKEKNAEKRRSELLPITDELAECLPDAADTEKAITEKELFSVVNRYLHSKTKTKRNIFIRRYYFADSVEEISRRFGISESKVKVELYRMRNELKKELNKEGYKV